MPPQDPSNLPYSHYEHSTVDCSNATRSLSLIEMAAKELDEMRQPPPRRPQPSRHHFLYSDKNNNGTCCSYKPQHATVKHCSFPPACYQLLQSIKGNNRCIDCGDYNPQWASVTYGTLVCLKCSGRHRSMGVKTSFIRSIHMDSWTPSQILSMLEGGNAQLSTFFDRHALSRNTCQPFLQKQNSETQQQDLVSIRYKTKAALFYRNMLAKHVGQVEEGGTYKGREEARKRAVLLQQRSDNVCGDSEKGSHHGITRRLYRRCTSSPPSAA